jgi:hypothetical protein
LDGGDDVSIIEPTDLANAAFDMCYDQEPEPEAPPPPDAEDSPEQPVDAPISLGEIVRDYPRLRAPVVYGLLRQGETGNIVAATKIGKSWLAMNLAVCTSLGRNWLGVFECIKGRVLYLDGELHHETLAHRFKTVCDAMKVGDDCRGSIDIWPLRGKSVDIHSLASRLHEIEVGRYTMIILDALYRFYPPGVAENSNDGMTAIYNKIDDCASRLGCAWVNVHHSSKGDQSGKSVTDVGSGAGAQSRATDAHVTIRPHETDGVSVLDAAVRSWPPVESLAIRWDYPLWSQDQDADPRLLKRPMSPRDAKLAAEDDAAFASIVDALNKNGPMVKSQIRKKTGITRTKLDRLLDVLESRGHVLSEPVVYQGNKTIQYRIHPSDEWGDDTDIEGLLPGLPTTP